MRALRLRRLFLHGEPRRRATWHALGRLVFATMFFGMGLATSSAQDFPTRAVRIVTITGTGGGADLIARLMAPQMSKVLGQAVFVENMPGGGGLLAHRYLVKQPPDGYTVLFSTGTAIAVPLFVKDAGFDIARDHVAVSVVAETPLVLSTLSSQPFSSFSDMVAYAKANPGKLNHGLPSSGDLNALIMEAVRQRFGLNIVDVPYKGSSPAFTRGLLASEVQLIITAPSSILGPFKANQIKILAVSGSKHLDFAPNVPTFSEAGVPDIDSIGFPVFVPAGTPKQVVIKLYDAISRSLQSQEVRDGLSRIGYQIVGSPPEVVARTLARQLEINQALAKKIGIVPQ